MSENTNDHEQAALAERRLAEARQWAKEIIGAGLEVVDLVETIAGVPLAAPTEKRDETLAPMGMHHTRAHEKAIRVALTEIGIGLETNRGLLEVGLPEDATVLIEAGQRHKMEAEKAILEEQTFSGPVIFSGSKYRAIAGAERTTTAKLFYGADEGFVGETEYDEAVQAALTMPGFELLESTVEIGRVASDGTLGDGEEDGVLTQIGTHQGGKVGVYIFDVPRRYLTNPDGTRDLDAKGNQRYVQPSAGQQMVAFGHLLKFESGAVATSSTYYPSRLAEVVTASFIALKEGTQVPRVEVIAYCPATLAAVKEETEPVSQGIPHLLGEAYRTRESLTKLQKQLVVE